MKIDRNKLNTLLRSGLNPEIKTRKHLAAHLNLDPTSLTRWFATRDRLGNPRYPVVPDRHVTKILQLFKLDPNSLSLGDEEFRQYCFENALTQSNHQNDLAQKNKVRLENTSQRQLDIADYSPARNNKSQWAIFTVAILLVVGWYVTNQFNFNESKPNPANHRLAENVPKCWTGYSESLGVFEEEDKADPCHYGKLFHRALMQLKAENKSLDLSASVNEDYATQDYITFLFQQLESRRISDNITLNIELGKSELHRSNYQAAQSYFRGAREMLSSLSHSNPELLAEISAYSEKVAKKLQ